MKLKDRYKRLTIWNKIGFWGSACSILAIIIIIVTAISSSLSSQRSEKLDESEFIIKINTEILTRLEKVKLELGKFFSDDWYATEEYKVEYLLGLFDAQSVVDEVLHVFPEFKDRTFISLLHELKSLSNSNEDEQINSALDTFSEIKQTLNEIRNDMSEEELNLRIQKVKYLLEKKLIPLRWYSIH